MQPQEIFDTVVRHLGKQGEPAMDAGGNCLYRGPDGTKCAVGCLIADKFYRQKMEGNGLEELISNDFALPKFIPRNAGLLVDLQCAHDSWSCGTRSAFIGDLLDIAEAHNLDAAVIVEAFPTQAAA